MRLLTESLIIVRGTTNIENMNRRNYLISFVVGISGIAGCTDRGDTHSDPSTETRPELPEEMFEDESDTCSPEMYEEVGGDIRYVSNLYYRTARRTYEVLDNTSYLRAAYRSSSNNEVQSVLFPPYIYRSQYIEYVLSTEAAVHRVKQNHHMFDDIRSAVDICDVPETHALLELVDDIEQKTDYYISAAEAFIAAAEIYQRNNIYLVGDENTHISGAVYIPLDEIPGPKIGREYLLQAIDELYMGYGISGVPNNLYSQLRYAAR